jgi:S1-C subfamily serine protease
VDIVKAVLPSVAQIRTGSGLGSGVVFDTEGDIVTNAHVVGSATTFQVTLPNRSTPLSGRLVGTYPPDDLAVIRVDGASGLHPATFGDSSRLAVGDIVLAMGSPLGLSSSVTNGIVSALGRTVTEPQTPDSPGATLPNVIQTSAAINPGNSGGALVDLDGQVVGIPTLAAVDPSQGALSGGAAPGIGFAIPSATVKNIAGQLVKSGKVTNSHRAALGVSITGVISGAGDPAGCGIVSVVSGGAAEKAGLRAGDIITAVDGTPTPDPAALAQALAQLKPGQQVSVTTTQAGSSPTKHEVTLGELPG